MSQPVQYSKLNPVEIEKYSPAETLVEGNPKQVVQSFFDSGDTHFKTGIWSGEKGAYRLEFSDTKYEFFYLVEGVVRVTADGGTPGEYRAGDACVIPAGFKGVFEIVEPARKYYAIGE